MLPIQEPTASTNDEAVAVAADAAFASGVVALLTAAGEIFATVMPAPMRSTVQSPVAESLRTRRARLTCA